MSDAPDAPSAHATTGAAPAPPGITPSVDDTAAFQRFYLEEQLAADSSPPPRSLLQRLLGLVRRGR